MKQRIKIGICAICGKEYNKNLRGNRSSGEKLTCSTECEIKYNREHQKSNSEKKNSLDIKKLLSQKKWKLILLASIICSLLCGLVAIGLYIRYLNAVSDNIGVSDADKLNTAVYIPLTFILGFITPSIAVVIQKISDYFP